MPGEKRPHLPEGFVRPNRSNNQPNRLYFHIPKVISDHVDYNQIFKVEATDEGILYRPVEDTSSTKPKWA